MTKAHHTHAEPCLEPVHLFQTTIKQGQSQSATHGDVQLCFELNANVHVQMQQW